MSSDAARPAIYVDADACPVKDEAVRVAERHGLAIHFVSNSWMRLPEGPLIAPRRRRRRPRRGRRLDRRAHRRAATSPSPPTSRSPRAA